MITQGRERHWAKIHVKHHNLKQANGIFIDANTIDDALCETDSLNTQEKGVEKTMNSKYLEEERRIKVTKRR